MRTAGTVLLLLAVGCTATYDSGDFEVCDAPACEDSLEPWAYPGACTPSTVACAEACDGIECVSGCLSLEGVLDACGLCGLNQLGICAREQGCRCEWEAYDCCRNENACEFGSECPACERTKLAWVACADRIAGRCEGYFDVCLE